VLVERQRTMMVIGSPTQAMVEPVVQVPVRLVPLDKMQEL
jgi:hypothetical protein